MAPTPTPRHNPKQESVNRNTYIPEHVRAQLDQQLQRNLPGHLKKYAGAYMQQQVYDPSMTGNASRPMKSAAPPPTYRPVTHLEREEHYVQYQGEPSQNSAQQPADQPHQVSAEEAYDFIVNPEVTKQKRSILPRDSSMPVRIAIIGGALVVLLILFTIIKGFLGGGSSLDSYVGVAQDQQAIIHIVSTANTQSGISESNKNFAATANVTLSSSQSDLIAYLAKNGQKVGLKQLGLKVSTTTDAQLAAAASAGTYNETFKEVVKTKIGNYMRDLQQTFQASDGEIGRSLLNSQYEQAKLLLIQLDDTKS